MSAFEVVRIGIDNVDCIHVKMQYRYLPDQSVKLNDNTFGDHPPVLLFLMGRLFKFDEILTNDTSHLIACYRQMRDDEYHKESTSITTVKVENIETIHIILKCVSGQFVIDDWLSGNAPIDIALGSRLFHFDVLTGNRGYSSQEFARYRVWRM